MEGSIQSLPDPDSIRTGTKWWHQCKESISQRAKVKGKFRLRHSQSWLQCVQTDPKGTQKHAELLEAGPNEEMEGKVPVYKITTRGFQKRSN